MFVGKVCSTMSGLPQTRLVAYAMSHAHFVFTGNWVGVILIGGCSDQTGGFQLDKAVLDLLSESIIHLWGF